MVVVVLIQQVPIDSVQDVVIPSLGFLGSDRSPMFLPCVTFATSLCKNSRIQDIDKVGI